MIINETFFMYHLRQNTTFILLFWLCRPLFIHGMTSIVLYLFTFTRYSPIDLVLSPLISPTTSAFA